MDRKFTKDEILIVNRHVRSVKPGEVPGTSPIYASLNTQSHSLALVMQSVSSQPGLLKSFCLQQMETALGIHNTSNAEIGNLHLRFRER